MKLTRLLFTGLREGRLRGLTSALSMYQLLAEPYRRGREDLGERAFKYLSGHPGLEILPVTEAVAKQAAEVQSTLGGRLERSVQIATALVGGARAYLVDKTTLRRIAGVEVITLEEHIG